jgi:prepilin-type processing-associated H-X9-DG protein
MKPFRSIKANRERDDAFTMIELLVIVAVVVLVAVIRLPALARATSQTKRAQCASNLRQFALAMHIYAGESQDRLPANTNGYWAWDVSGYIGTFVEGTGSKWTVMYCPATAPEWTEADNWNLYNYSPPDYRVLGYANTFPGNPGVVSTNVNVTLTPTAVPVSFGIYATPTASQRVLLADVTMSSFGQDNPAARYTYNFTVIQGGYPRSHTSAHLTGRFPSGGNLGMLDGHVEWRKFDDMTPRTQGNGSPVFWW